MGCASAILRLLTCIALALFGMAPHTARAGLAGPPEEIAPGVFLLYSQFGSWKSGNIWGGFTPTTVIEMKDGREFGWRLRVRTEKDSVKLKVVLTLPAPPKIWAHQGEIIEGNASRDGTMTISADRRTSTTESEHPVVDGWVLDGWSSAEGDPVGDHVVRIYANEKLVRVFRFQVVAPKK